MMNIRVIQGIRNEGKSFFQAVGRSSEVIYLILLSLYVALFYFLKIQWIGLKNTTFDAVRYGTLSLVMWGSALYLTYVIAEWKNLWKKTFSLIIVAAVLLAATYFFTKGMSTNVYGVVMDFFFCVLAYKKDFRKILKCMLGVCVVMLLIAGLGMPLGITGDVGKPETNLPGHSLGINYPNTWGYLVFLGLIILWYLYLRNKPLLTFPIFWAVSWFMYNYIICRTIAGLTLLFPVVALIVDNLEKWMDRRSRAGTFKRLKLLEWCVTVIPFIAWAFMMYSSYQVDWWHKYYHGSLRNLAWRFIQGGLYFRTYGIPMIGNPYRSNQVTYVVVQNEFIKVGILDSSFAAYLIMRGVLWLCYTLLWLSVAHYKALKKRDYAIILIETFFLGFAMMERPGLEMWYNFILLYPLARVFNKPRTERFMEFDDTAENDKGTRITEFEKEYNSFMQIKSFPMYRTEDSESISVGYDEEKGVYILNLPADLERKQLYDSFTEILYTERFVKGDVDKKPVSAGFNRYGETQVQLSYQMGYKSIKDNVFVEMEDIMKDGTTLRDYVVSRYNNAIEAFSSTSLNEEAILAFYEYLGARSFCEMYSTDFDREDFDCSIFKEKLGSGLYCLIDNHMHGRADEFLYNMCIKDYREVRIILEKQ